MRFKEIMEAVMSVGVQSKYPVSPGARSLMASRWRYDRAVEQNVSDSLKGAVDQLEHNLKYIPDTKFDSIDLLMQTICEKFRVEPKKLHDEFVKKFNCSPDKYAVNYKKSREGQPIKI
jgi:hypothetical protein